MFKKILCIILSIVIILAGCKQNSIKNNISDNHIKIILEYGIEHLKEVI